MISRFAFVIAATAGLCGSALPAGAEDVIGPAGVMVGHDRDRDREHGKTVIIKKDHDGDRDKTVIKKDHDRD